MKIKFKLNPKAVILISVLIAVVMFTSAYIELNQSKRDIFQLLYEHSSTLIESIIQSSDNTLNASFEIEDIITERLLNNARLIRRLDDANKINEGELIRIGENNNLFRINIFDRNGNRILTNRVPEPEHEYGEENINRTDRLAPILTGETDELVIGLKHAEFIEGERFAVAVARSNNRGAIVINIDAEEFLEFRKRIGIGKILQEMTKHHGIEYIVLQDTLGIIAASEKIDTIEAIPGSGFLMNALSTDSTFSRVTDFASEEVYEVAKQFVFDGEIVGIYRIGISLEDVRNVESRMIRRLIIISLILAAISIIVLSIIFTTQNLQTVSEEYEKFKTLTSSVLENMDEAVIVLDKKKNITLFNRALNQLFSKEINDAIGENILEFSSNILQLTDKDFELRNYFERQVLLDNSIRYLLIGNSIIYDNNNEPENFVIVIKDLTEIKQLEKEAAKNEKLTAMGELASGVAHEIRNPINAIGMIAQRLNKEFKVPEHQKEYEVITGLLRSEVNRINKIITQFLNYAKPLDIKTADVDLRKYFDEIKYLFAEYAKQKQINFVIQNVNGDYFRFDPDLIKQALINIIQNAFDAVSEQGEVRINYKVEDKRFFVEIKDNGPGIPPEIQKRIFDLYFTTRSNGNGLGLSIAQNIIAQHNGSIYMSSTLNKGTTFKIILAEK
ncbi:MAG: PAS domain S-box protein [Ignavibacterium sp.]|nr:PAS domain S-box protein [Ignavibacterium sp.]